ncbi:MAG: DUF3179 domain-containing protein [Halobacteriales archaeon]
MAAFAGCLGGSSTGNPAGAETATEHNGPTTTKSIAASNSGNASSVAGIELPLPKDKLNRGAAKDAIPAITDPVFGSDWSNVEADQLQAEDKVIGVTRGDEARAYPLRILNWHEIANDTFDGPLLVSYCPLCGSALTAVRRVKDQETIFGVSGFLWNSDLVMYDKLTESLWSQIAATAIRGPRTGQQLTLVPSQLTSWATWTEDHPDTKVLLPPPKSKTIQGEVSRNYNTNPYAGYEETSRIGIGSNDLPESKQDVHPKTQVLGITASGVAKAYPLPAVQEVGVVNDTVGDLPVVVTVASDEATLVGYVRQINGETLHFEKVSAKHLRADGSSWSITTGRALSGPHEGTKLKLATKKPQMFWFAWLDFHPETEVYSPG